MRIILTTVGFLVARAIWRWNRTIELERAVVIPRGVSLPIDCLLECIKIVFGTVQRSELCDAGLQQPPSFQHRRDFADPHLRALVEQAERDHLRFHEHAATRPRADFYHPGIRQNLDRFAHRRPADLHLHGQVALGWQAVPHLQIAGLHNLGDLGDGLLERPARSNRLKHGWSSLAKHGKTAAAIDLPETRIEPNVQRDPGVVGL